MNRPLMPLDTMSSSATNAVNINNSNTYATPKPTEAHDIESQSISTAAPVYGYPVCNATVVDVVGTDQPARIIYVAEPNLAVEGFAGNDPHPELLTCAMVGFLFSWIPIVGIATFLLNMNAPRGSPRHTFAQSACCVTTFVIFFNLIFWTAWGY